MVAYEPRGKSTKDGAKRQDYEIQIFSYQIYFE